MLKRLGNGEHYAVPGEAYARRKIAAVRAMGKREYVRLCRTPADFGNYDRSDVTGVARSEMQRAPTAGVEAIPKRSVTPRNNLRWQALGSRAR